MGISEASAAESDWVTSCKSIQINHSGKDFKGKYCVFKDQRHGGDDVLYYFAGRGSDEKKWKSEGRGFRDQWEKDGVRPPTVVAIVFGSWWLLNEKDDKGDLGYFPVVTETLMPQIERELGGLKGRRLLMGRSMGGYNASQLLLKRPRDFARAVLLCPAIMQLSPYAGSDETDEYKRRTGAQTTSVWVLKKFFRDALGGEDAWKSGSPLEIGPDHLGEDTPPVHISCGRDDHYGFHEGADLFAQMTSSLSGNEVVWQSVSGNHCSFDSAATARFLELPRR